MKITKQQLKQLIKEEMSSVLQEQAIPMSPRESRPAISSPNSLYYGPGRPEWSVLAGAASAIYEYLADYDAHRTTTHRFLGDEEAAYKIRQLLQEVINVINAMEGPADVGTKPPAFPVGR